MHDHAVIVIGIGDMAVSSNVEETIKTYALGSCVALIMYDGAAHLGGMVHIALFDSSLDPVKGTKRPGHFADTAVPALLDLMKKQGSINRSNLKVYLVGGAGVFSHGDFFKVGEKNRNRIIELLKEHGLKLTAEDTGGDISRTVSLSVSDGQVTVSNARKGSWTL